MPNELWRENILKEVLKEDISIIEEKHLLKLAQNKGPEPTPTSIISIHMYRQKILLALIFPLFDRHYPFLP